MRDIRVNDVVVAAEDGNGHEEHEGRRSGRYWASVMSVKLNGDSR
jgi:hypothetical protein